MTEYQNQIPGFGRGGSYEPVKQKKAQIPNAE
jgi:hypothetical protein